MTRYIEVSKINPDIKHYIIFFEMARGEYNETTFIHHSCEPKDLLPFLEKEYLIYQFREDHWDSDIFEVKNVTNEFIVVNEQ